MSRESRIVRLARPCKERFHALEGGSRLVNPSAPNEQLDTLLQAGSHHPWPTTRFAKSRTFPEKK
jgi:hypothetical protein